ncbi:MAG: gamma-glutamyltransferase [Gemmatimonadota bacterium]|jgi:gamma-glutamyltranspeptidase/glutathione hydrolase
MVATTDHRASRIGVDVLEAGGNAVDAVVAVSFALAVVNPEAGNVGGSGFMLVRLPDGTTAALDYRGVAPKAATADMFASNRGERDDPSQLGHLAVAVPGSVRGLQDAHDRFGSMDWALLVEPAVELARGFAADDRLRRSYEPHIVDGLARFGASAQIFLPDGEPPPLGKPFRQTDLAHTLERIRDGGADGFYRGETADLIVEEMRRGGGLLTHEDLTSYTAVWREPVRFGYRGHTVVSMPPSSSGGVTLAAAAHILACWDLTGLPWHGTRHVHMLAEAWRRAFADRNHYLADPDRVAMPIETLCSAAYGLHRASGISPDTATPSDEVSPGAEAFDRERHTTHVSIVDPAGGAASLTTTLNTWYGSKVVAAGTGVLLNNEMDDFTARPGVPNHFGLVQGEANAVAPGKRMLSAMTPTLVLDSAGDLALVLGAPGGSTIITTVFQVISNIVDHGMSLVDAVAAPRVHHQHLPDRISVEPGGLAAEVVERLRAMGHEVKEAREPWGDVEAVGVGPAGVLEGVADPRRGGTALGI